MKSVVGYLEGVKREFSKVNWPTKVELIGSTLVVLALVAICSVYLWGLDLLFSFLSRNILSL